MKILIAEDEARRAPMLLAALAAQTKVAELRPPSPIPADAVVIAPSVQTAEALVSGAWGKYTITNCNDSDYPSPKTPRNNAKEFGMSRKRRR